MMGCHVSKQHVGCHKLIYETSTLIRGQFGWRTLSISPQSHNPRLKVSREEQPLQTVRKVGVPMEHEEAFDIDKMVVHVNWADLVNRLTSSPSYFRIELRIAKTEKAKKLDVPEEIADFFRVYGISKNLFMCGANQITS